MSRSALILLCGVVLAWSAGIRLKTCNTSAKICAEVLHEKNNKTDVMSINIWNDSRVDPISDTALRKVRLSGLQLANSIAISSKGIILLVSADSQSIAVIDGLNKNSKLQFVSNSYFCPTQPRTLTVANDAKILSIDAFHETVVVSCNPDYMIECAWNFGERKCLDFSQSSASTKVFSGEELIFINEISHRVDGSRDPFCDAILQSLHSEVFLRVRFEQPATSDLVILGKKCLKENGINVVD